MKFKKILGFLAVLLIAVMAAWNVNFGSQTKGMSDLKLANVEALAREENGDGNKVKQIVTTDEGYTWVNIDGVYKFCLKKKNVCSDPGNMVCPDEYTYEDCQS